MEMTTEWAKRYFGNLYERVKLPKGLSPSSRLTAQKVLERYLAESETFWVGRGLRHAAKVQEALRAFAEAGAKGEASVAKMLLDRVREVRFEYYRPFFVMGAGGSGSTWLGAMLGDLPGFQYGREIYLPRGISYLYRRLRNREMSDLVWAVMLLHAWGFNCPEEEFKSEFVNSARSIFNYDIYKEIWPQGRFIFLVRDPRDQILSVTYRKSAYRKAVAPKSSDREYLLRNARRFMKIYRQYKRIDPAEIHVTTYEKLRGDTRSGFMRILERFQLDFSDDTTANILYQHDAENIRTGKVDWKGNLDEGGISKSWRESITDQEKQLLRPIIQDALEEFGYERNDNWAISNRWIGRPPERSI
ncbi:MAG: hypothetical protein GTO24_11655 [candidate division Zixibacteria bacterium]|nr:hypothetical protein [candidate division Zixibacteria bacterium]